MVKLRPIAAALLTFISTVSVCALAHAEPLERAECNALKVQKQKLYTPMVRSALTRGPDWAKEHLHDHEKIEQVRQYLLVEEKVAFRCRTNSVRIPKPLPPSLPDRKPPVPTFVVAGVAASSLIPLRNPFRTASSAATAIAAGNADGSDTPARETPIAKIEDTQSSPMTPPASADPAENTAGASQTVAESDMTPPSDNEAAQ